MKNMIGLIALLTVSTAQVQADIFIAELIIAPKQCVAMHQGQDCYATVDLSWQTAKKGQYCLFSSQQQKPLRCWSINTAGHYQYELVAHNNVHFALKEKGNENTIATAIIEMSWVYKKSRASHSSWRMF